MAQQPTAIQRSPWCRACRARHSAGHPSCGKTVRDLLAAPRSPTDPPNLSGASVDPANPNPSPASRAPWELELEERQRAARKMLAEMGLD